MDKLFTVLLAIVTFGLSIIIINFLGALFFGERYTEKRDNLIHGVDKKQAHMVKYAQKKAYVTKTKAKGMWEIIKMEVE
jgi:hypothetical protein